MEWSKSTISRAELEKKQREYMEAAMNMAKRAGNTVQAVRTAPETAIKEKIVEEIVEEVDDLTETLGKIAEKTEEMQEEKKGVQKEIAEIMPEIEDTAEKTEDKFGVFNTDELVTAIENGEVSGEGLKQAAEILEEMTRKTEAMRKLVEEQENEEDFADGGDYGLNGFVNRHNSNCRGCGNESGTQSP